MNSDIGDGTKSFVRSCWFNFFFFASPSTLLLDKIIYLWLPSFFFFFFLHLDIGDRSRSPFSIPWFGFANHSYLCHTPVFLRNRYNSFIFPYSPIFYFIFPVPSHISIGAFCYSLAYISLLILSYDEPKWFWETTVYVRFIGYTKKVLWQNTEKQYTSFDDLENYSISKNSP